MRSRHPHRFHGLHPDFGGSALPTTNNGAAGFASCYGPLSRSPTRAFDAGLRRRAFPPDAASLLPGPLAATRTGLTPAGDDEADKTDHPNTMTSHLLGARKRESKVFAPRVLPCDVSATSDRRPPP